MKTKIKLLFTVISILTVVCSCDKSVSLDTREKRKVAVECVLTPNSTQHLNLMYSKGASKDEAQPLTEAVVTLIDLSRQETVGQFKKKDGSLWTLDYAGIPDHKYRLEIQVPGYDLISSEQTMPKIDVRSVCWNEIEHTHHFFEEWQDIETRYKSIDFTLFLLYYVPDNTWIYAMCYNPLTGKREVAERICTDYPLLDDFNLTGEVYSPEIHARAVNGKEKDYSLYPDLIGSNMHRRYLRIPKGVGKLYNPGGIVQLRDYMQISGDFIGKMFFREHWRTGIIVFLPGQESMIPEDEGYIAFSAVSGDYDEYLREAIHLQQLQESTDLSSIYVRDNVYSNINGGLGIFGAVYELKFMWSDTEGPLTRDSD